jgi:uncharacterized ion transporter superfamily protein YfcC
VDELPVWLHQNTQEEEKRKKKKKERERERERERENSLQAKCTQNNILGIFIYSFIYFLFAIGVHNFLLRTWVACS